MTFVRRGALQTGARVGSLEVGPRVRSGPVKPSARSAQLVAALGLVMALSMPRVVGGEASSGADRYLAVSARDPGGALVGVGKVLIAFRGPTLNALPWDREDRPILGEWPPLTRHFLPSEFVNGKPPTEDADLIRVRLTAGGTARVPIPTGATQAYVEVFKAESADGHPLAALAMPPMRLQPIGSSRVELGLTAAGRHRVQGRVIYPASYHASSGQSVRVVAVPQRSFVEAFAGVVDADSHARADVDADSGAYELLGLAEETAYRIVVSADPWASPESTHLAAGATHVPDIHLPESHVQRIAVRAVPAPEASQLAVRVFRRGDDGVLRHPSIPWPPAAGMPTTNHYLGLHPVTSSGNVTVPGLRMGLRYAVHLLAVTPRGRGFTSHRILGPHVGAEGDGHEYTFVAGEDAWIIEPRR